MLTPLALIEVFNDPQRSNRGNISGVVELEKPWSDGAMQALALDLHQPATTFLWPLRESGHFGVRWFAPDGEIDLCGHGSLAAVAWLAREYPGEKEYHLHYRTGTVEGRQMDKDEARIGLKAIPVEQAEVPAALVRALAVPVEAFFTSSNKQIVLLESEELLREMKPDFVRLRQLDYFGYAITAPSTEVDFVSRTIVPHVQQLEDHATGSSHAVLTPFWSERLGKKDLRALQVSPRGGVFGCELRGDTVYLNGHYTWLSEGQWLVD